MNARCHRKCRDKTYTLRGILKNTKKKSDRRFIHGLLSEIKAFNEFKVQVQFWQQLHRKAACLNNDLVFSMLANDSRPLCCSGSLISQACPVHHDELLNLGSSPEPKSLQSRTSGVWSSASPPLPTSRHDVVTYELPWCSSTLRYIAKEWNEKQNILIFL